MNNGIIQRQNEEKSIMYLAAQRQIYNEVKKYDCVGIIFSVIIPIFLSVLELFLKKNQYLNIMSKVLSMAGMFVAMGVNTFVARRKKDAAEIQQQFDLYVFQMEWDEKLFGKKRNLSSLIAEKSKKLLAKTGEEAKLYNWYTVSVESTTHTNGVWLCQKVNFWWDVNLRKRFIRCSRIVIGILSAVVLVLGIVNNDSMYVLIERVFFIFPMLSWLYATNKQLKNDIENLQEIDEIINSPEPKSMDDLQAIQSKIYIHRKSCFAIPNFFYQKYKNNDEDVAYRTVLLDK